MNRIYQGRVVGVEIPIKVTLPTKEGRKAKSEIRWLPFHTNQQEAQRLLDEVKPRLSELGNVIGDLITKLQKARGAQNNGHAEQIAKDITKAKTELRELRKKLDEPWQTALWEHHQLFQDMVNYYTVALAAMAEGDVDKEDKSTAMADFATQVKERWQSFTHKGKNRAGLRQSFCRTLGLPDDETSTWEICAKKILKSALKHFPERKDAKGVDVFHRVIAEMYPEKSRGNPQQMSNSDWPWLCWKNATGETPAKSFYRKNHGIHDFLSELFNADEKGLAKLANKEVADTFLTSVEQADDDEASAEDVESPNDRADELPKDEADGVKKFTGMRAVTKLRACINTARELLTEDVFSKNFALMGGNINEADSFFVRIEKSLADKENECKEKPESLSFQEWNTGGKGKDNKKIELFVLFGFDKGSAFTTALLKARVKKLHLDRLLKADPAGYVALVEKYGLCGPAEREDERVDGKEPFKIVADTKAKAEKASSDKLPATNEAGKGYTDYIQTIRDKNGIVFPGFTAIRGFVTPAEENIANGGEKFVLWKIGTTEWKNFEFAAFEEALKSPNQIKKKTEERAKERKKLQATEKLYKGKGREKATDEDGEDEGHLPGFKDDDRFSVIEALHKTLAVEDGVEPGKTYEYGFSQAALRGYEEPDALQVAAHALLLREHGVNAVRGAIYYAADKRRVPVEFTEELFEKVRKAIADAKQVANSGSCPPPLKNDARCLYCSAYPICLPNESLWWSKRRKPADSDAQIQFGFIAQSEDTVRDQIMAALDFAAESGSARAPRAVVSAPADDDSPEASDGASKATREGARAPLTLQPPRPEGDDGEVLVVQTPGAQIGQRGDELIVSVKGEDVRKLPGQQVRAIYCYGAVQITAQAISTCLELGIDVSYFSPAGRFLGMLGGLPASGVDARRGQYRLFELPGVRLQLAREVIRAKIHNQRVMLMRNGDVPDRVTSLMAGFRDATESARDLTQLLGIEGSAAAIYFEQFETMLKQREDWKFDWRGRNRRPPRDPVNALLSLGYSMLAKELTGFCHSVGLDPFLGFMHQPRYGRPALALDLMEEFRPLVADSVAISLINRGELGPEDFIRSANGTFLNDRGRRPFWEAWFRRLDAEVSHPEFSYKMAYRRMLEVQARQLWRFARGEALTYHGFTTR